MNRGNITKQMNTADISLEAMQKTMNAFREQNTRKAPEVYVMLTSTYLLLRNKTKPAPQDVRYFEGSELLYGVRLEHYGTPEEAHERCLELWRNGKNVALIVP